MISVRVAILGAVACVVAACAVAGSGQVEAGACRPAQEGHHESRMAYLRELVSSPDPDRVEMRRQIGLVAAAPDVVRSVEDARTCQRAVAAVNTRHETLGLERSIWVFRLADAYAVEDPTGHRRGERIGIQFFDKDFGFLRTVYAF
jgi:hypothetical protein